MENPRKFRVAERHFLNLPGFHAGAYIRAEVQDTSEQEVRLPEGKRAGWAPTPRIELEIADCDNRVRIYFDLEDADDRLNSFHKIDTLINALVAFRDAMAEEAALRRRRLRRIEAAAVGDHRDAFPSGAPAARAVRLDSTAA